MARFCTQCGRPLEEGEVCTCQQGGTVQAGAQPQQAPQGQPGGQTFTGSQGQNYAGGQGQYAGQSYNSGAAPQGNQFTEQAGQMVDQFTATTKNLFGRLIPMIKRPATELGAMAENEETSLGVQMVILHLVVTAIMTIVSLLIVKSQLGVMAEFVEIPYVKSVLGMLLATAAIDFGLAALLLVTTKFIFKSDLGYGSMLVLVGGMAVVNAAALIVAGILMIISTQLATIILAVGGAFGMFYMLGGYFKAVEVSEDEKVYALSIAYAIFLVILFIVCKLLLKDVTDTLSGMLY